jgi:hypothetical protein
MRRLSLLSIALTVLVIVTLSAGNALAKGDGEAPTDRVREKGDQIEQELEKKGHDAEKKAEQKARKAGRSGDKKH